jgi:hypothetical protein
LCAGALQVFRWPVLLVSDQAFDAGFVQVAHCARRAQEGARDAKDARVALTTIYEKLAEAQVFAEAKQYTEAEAVLDDMLECDQQKEQVEPL